MASLQNKANAWCSLYSKDGSDNDGSCDDDSDADADADVEAER